MSPTEYISSICPCVDKFSRVDMSYSNPHQTPRALTNTCLLLLFSNQSPYATSRVCFHTKLLCPSYNIFCALATSAMFNPQGQTSAGYANARSVNFGNSIAGNPNVANPNSGNPNIVNPNPNPNIANPNPSNLYPHSFQNGRRPHPIQPDSNAMMQIVNTMLNRAERTSFLQGGLAQLQDEIENSPNLNVLFAPGRIATVSVDPSYVPPSDPGAMFTPSNLYNSEQPVPEKRKRRAPEDVQEMEMD
ncbi:hypothetical protein K470DRAFT_104281 [Piedraia hortae CBS 480.64]|uniref:Uncharacterized protein n=1 Tax=Piedraia hortae CBS 480.64 TaxID=1314780 RepID=A0A6A7C7Y3_9PEZI|nr:hypothetical protein K470DRAFT_104281 [Piedraia hortae CBS 480.64]